MRARLELFGLGATCERLIMDLMRNTMIDFSWSFTGTPRPTDPSTIELTIGGDFVVGDDVPVVRFRLAEAVRSAIEMHLNSDGAVTDMEARDALSGIAARLEGLAGDIRSALSEPIY